MEMTTFQKGILGIFFVAMIVGVAFFAVQRGGDGKSASEVVMWGTVDADLMNSVSDALNEADYNLGIKYRFIEEDRLVQTVLEALAAGTGPDIVMFPSDRFMELEDKFQRIPYDVLSEREFQDIFIEAGEMFMDYNGIVALPIMVDPLITYWNRDLYSNAAVSRPPLFWDELPALIPSLTKTDGTRTIYQSAIGMGEYQNVAHAKNIMQALLLQSGNPVITRIAATSNRAATFDAVLTRRFERALDPASAALSFFTQFADPSRDTYTWNRSLRMSTDAFAAGELATYFGFASELPDIQRQNPNLNYDVAPFPQARAATAKRSFGRVWGLAIPKNSKNAGSAYTTMLAITSQAGVSALSADSVLPPVRRDMLTTPPGNTWGRTFYDAAFTVRGVYDIPPTESNKVFRDMIEAVTSGRAGADNAVSRAEAEMDTIIGSRVNVWAE
jgi:ABC-type glycerol-3-phosphate transport system substrate-binding protein